eukprot:m.30115 g.30115  ORF g.30115 m.30115 type:complete len:413 (+) comp9217_c0_seq2:131-1369(+)
MSASPDFALFSKPPFIGDEIELRTSIMGASSDFWRTAVATLHHKSFYADQGASPTRLPIARLVAPEEPTFESPLYAFMWFNIYRVLPPAVDFIRFKFATEGTELFLVDALPSQSHEVVSLVVREACDRFAKQTTVVRFIPSACEVVVQPQTIRTPDFQMRLDELDKFKRVSTISPLEPRPFLVEVETNARNWRYIRESHIQYFDMPSMRALLIIYINEIHLGAASVLWVRNRTTGAIEVADALLFGYRREDQEGDTEDDKQDGLGIAARAHFAADLSDRKALPPVTADVWRQVIPCKPSADLPRATVIPFASITPADTPTTITIPQSLLLDDLTIEHPPGRLRNVRAFVPHDCRDADIVIDTAEIFRRMVDAPFMRVRNATGSLLNPVVASLLGETPRPPANSADKSPLSQK